MRTVECKVFHGFANYEMSLPFQRSVIGRQERRSSVDGSYSQGTGWDVGYRTVLA